MLADTTAIRGLADAMRRRAEEILDEASRLRYQSADAAWDGLAAEEMRARACTRTDALRRTATLHDLAATALDHHADEVDHAIAVLQAAADAARDAARDALDAASNAAHDALDAAGDSARGLVDSTLGTVGSLPGLLR